MVKKYYLLFFVFFVFSHLHAGDFSLGPRIFTEKGRMNVQEFFVYTKFDRASSALFSTDFGYGFTKNTGIQVNLPIMVAKAGPLKTKGFGDILVLGQWHFYKTKNNVALLLFGGKFPTSTTDKRISSRGRGAFAFISDVGFIHSSEHWYAQARTTFIFTDKHKNIKTGFEDRWSMGGGHRWNYKGGFSLFALLQFAGVHRTATKVDGIVVPNTSGHQIFILPEIFCKKGDITGGFGIGIPIMQNIGLRPKVKWILGALIDKKF